MVTGGQLYLVVVTVMTIAALVAAIPVLLRIARDGREGWRSGPTEFESPTPAGSNQGDESSPERPTCPHCGTPNDPSFTYCRSCAGQL